MGYTYTINFWLDGCLPIGIDKTKIMLLYEAAQQ